MTVTLRHNERLELNRVEYSGSISLAELSALASFNAANPIWLSYDCLNLIAPGSDFDSVDLTALDAIFKKYRTLFQPLQFVIFRRSAWLCESGAARAHVAHWLGGRDTREAMSSDMRQFDTYAEAGDWLVLSPEQTAMLEHSEGFAEIVAFTIAPTPARAAAR